MPTRHLTPTRVTLKKLYNDLRELANVTSKNFCVYLKLFSVTDANQWRLVRSKMSSIFKPSMRQALNLNALDSFKGIFGGDPIVLKNLDETNG